MNQSDADRARTEVPATHMLLRRSKFLSCIPMPGDGGDPEHAAALKAYREQLEQTGRRQNPGRAR